MWTHWFINRSDRGATMVEYALMVAMIAMVCVAAVTFLGGATTDSLSGANSSIFSSIAP